MMDCLCVSAPKDEELLRHVLKGEALPKEAGQHLEHCTICQQRLFHYRSIDNHLFEHLYRFQCPGSVLLNQYCLGILSVQEHYSITQHLMYCPLCVEDVVAMRNIPPSPLWQTEIDQLFRWVPAIHSVADSSQRGTASSIPEHRQNTPAYCTVSVWPHHYQADAVQLSLQASYDAIGDHGISLCGLLSHIYVDEVATLFVGVKAELYKAMEFPGEMYELHAVLAAAMEGEATDDFSDPIAYMPEPVTQPLFSTRADDSGSIVFRSIPSGDYLLIVHLPETALVIERLHIQTN